MELSFFKDVNRYMLYLFNYYVYEVLRFIINRFIRYLYNKLICVGSVYGHRKSIVIFNNSLLKNNK